MEKEKIICISGGADFLHCGHIRMINDAAKYGKIIWILNSDKWLKTKKGYLLMSWEDRAEILRSIRNIFDVVAVEDEQGGTVCEALARIKPDYFGKGGYSNEFNTPEYKFCQENGIEVIFGLGGPKVKSAAEMIDEVVNSLVKKLDRILKG